jgi:5-methylcytosine-specific restriction endonuclease McrA
MPRGVYPRKKKELHLDHVRDAHVGHGMERSPHWPTVQHKHLKKFPTCAACGGNVNLNVHHKQPFHLYPELELEPTNLITLCMDGDKDCHIKLGHGSNFKAYNPHVEAHVEIVKASFSMELLNETAAVAKKARLLV